jgi:hypothetical protein
MQPRSEQMRLKMCQRIGIFLFITLMMGIGLMTAGMTSVTACAQQGSNRIAATIDDEQLTTLTGNMHPLAKPEYDQGEIAPDTRLEKMVLVLKNSPAQQAELDSLADEQQTAGSPEFHHWLTAAEYGRRFGASEDDLEAITQWLESYGFIVNEIGPSRLIIEFSGTAGDVAKAFHTEIHRYLIPRTRQDGSMELEAHIANARNPEIPTALAEIVQGVLSLHNFRRTASLLSRVLPEGEQGMNASDFASIYDLRTLYTEGTRGAGVTIAIVGRSNIIASDIARYRALNGLVTNVPTVTAVGTDPGLVAGDQDDATLGVEWSGAVAPDATVNLVAASSSETTDGADLSSLYAVDHRAGVVISSGFSSCEQDMGATELSFYDRLWQQAAIEGISIVVASGNSGAACDVIAENNAVAGINGLCSSQYATCVGGTEFSPDVFAQENWEELNPIGSSHANSYRMEFVWNESASAGVSQRGASGGGISRIYKQPAWQHSVISEIIQDNMRVVPDVSLAAASTDSYLTYQEGALRSWAGTSAAAASFAGILALAVQAIGGNGMGNINPMLYAMLKKPSTPFHATVAGNNHMRGVNGFDATGAAYNFATGLGSVDGTILVKNWADELSADNHTVTGRPSAQTYYETTLKLDPTGKSDSTAALQAVIDAASSTVTLPAGNYLIGCTNPLYLAKNNISYVGAGEGKTILRSCQGHTVDVISWICKPLSGANCTTGKGPYTFVITTSTPLLEGIDTYYCGKVGSSETCSLDNWHNEFPSSLGALFIFNGPGIPNALSNSLTNPIFNCGVGCESLPTEQTSFTVTSTVAPTVNSGSIARFSLPQNMIQAYDPRSNTRQTGIHFSKLTFDGNCDACVSTSFDTGLVDMRNPHNNAHVMTANVFSNVTFSNYASTAVREDDTTGDEFSNITFTNGGNTGILADSPNNMTITNITAVNFGWETDVRVVNTGAVYAALLNFGCTTGGHTINVQNVTAQPSKNSQFVGLGMFCIASTVQTETKSAFSGIQVSNFTIISAGNQLLPVSAFADNMTIQGMRIQGYPDPAYESSPYMEVAGSDLNIYGNSGIGVYFAPLDEGAQVDGGNPVHTHYANINIHDNTINCTTPTSYNTGCSGFSIGGFQNSEGNTIVSYIDTVNIYNNVSHYVFGPVNEGHIVHISLGANEGGNGSPAGQLTNVHVYNENVTITGSQSMGSGWSAFAILWGGNKNNGNWKFDNDTVKWTNSKTISCLNHIRAMPGVSASNVTAQSESTPANPLLTNKSGGTFTGIVVLP